MATAQENAQSQVLRGVFDVHAHAHPDRTERSIDALELAELYAEHGLRGMVLENHFDPTAGLAYLARKAAPELEVFGGIVLNRLVGGRDDTPSPLGRTRTPPTLGAECRRAGHRDLPSEPRDSAGRCAPGD
jgi:hypothetical protein